MRLIKCSHERVRLHQGGKKMKNKSNYYIGLILVIVGSAAFYNSVFLNGFFGVRNLWPLFILLPGLFMEIDYFAGDKLKGRDPGVLIPGGILTGMGTFLLLREFLDIIPGMTGPVMIAVTGAALLQFYVAKPRDRGLLVVSLALILIGVLLGISRYTGELPVWLTAGSLTSLAVIMAGVYLIAKKPQEYKDSTYRPRDSENQKKSQ